MQGWSAQKTHPSRRESDPKRLTDRTDESLSYCIVSLRDEWKQDVYGGLWDSHGHDVVLHYWRDEPRDNHIKLARRLNAE